MTELMVRQPTVAQTTIPAELAADAPTVVTAVPCAYCRAAIPADSFVYWSPAKRLLSASCPSCHRRPPVATRARRGQQSLGWGPVDEGVRRDRRPAVGARHRRDYCGCVGGQLGGNGCLRDGWLADHQFRHRSHCCLRLASAERRGSTRSGSDPGALAI